MHNTYTGVHVSSVPVSSPGYAVVPAHVPELQPRVEHLQLHSPVAPVLLNAHQWFPHSFLALKIGQWQGGKGRGRGEGERGEEEGGEGGEGREGRGTL